MLANFLGQLVFALQVISNFTLAERIQHLEVFENVPPGTRIGYIEGDSSPYLVVPVPGSSVESDLIIDQATGEISTRVSLDREKRDSYSLVSLPQNIRVIVHVLDENDNSPSFSTTEIDVVFPENAARDLRCALPYALDPDIGQFSTQRYDIVSGNVGSIFKLSQHRGRDGVLYLDLQSSGVLDYETQSKYKLLVEALDGGLPPLSARLLININIQDMNDNPPIFQQIRYKASVLENSSIGTTVLTVSATDADSGINGQLEYYINRRQSDRDEIFRIDHETGIVYVNRQLDFEICEQHEIVLVARDRGVQSLEATAFLSVYIVNVNDNQPSISVIFLSDDKTPKISENAQPGDFLARVSVSDPDSHNGYSNVTVSLKGGGGHFDLITRDSIIYLIVVNQTLDREVEPYYELSLKATDTGMPPLQAISSFRLLITDTNDNAPHFIGEPYKAQLFEAVELGSSVLQVLAKDLDDGLNGQVQYNILSYSNDGKNRNKKSSDGRVSNSRSDKMNRNLFTIDKNSGLITVVCHLECETNSVHILVIVASDLGEPALSSSTTVQLEIYDANNSEPILEKTFYNATIPENTPQGTCFLKV
ncbi:protein dachsous-like [Copidosoma floridanum]|uniref:protein dachsous-like n=1 Tax=Copidosoma floridanum TaxID=29053 RepID=UPI000C6F72A3|nr:protein dachsous-like [Copidosoma floridanum]